MPHLPRSSTSGREEWGSFLDARRFSVQWKKEVEALNTIQDVYLCKEITIA